MQATDTHHKRPGILGIAITLLIVGILIAVGWSLFVWVFATVLKTVVLGVKIAIVLGVVVALLALFGWFRVKVLKH
ncbi:MAG: hypothetical protein DYH08_14360 [Actinobacteria bacterium ATB1]|nr:hypothetical protein [Actinobacteria bacterium ATB1]